MKKFIKSLMVGSLVVLVNSATFSQTAVIKTSASQLYSNSSSNFVVPLRMSIQDYPDAILTYTSNGDVANKIVSDSLIVSGFGSVTVTAVCTNHQDVEPASFTFVFTKDSANQLYKASCAPIYYVNDSTHITLSPTPADGVNFYYKSTNEAVVKVDSRGTVTATGVGQAEVTVTNSTDNSIQILTFTIVQRIESIKYFAQDTLTVIAGKTYTLQTNSDYDNLVDIAVETNNSVLYYWSYNKSFVGTKSGYGVLAAIDKGGKIVDELLVVVEPAPQYFLKRKMTVVLGQTVDLPINPEWNKDGSYIADFDNQYALVDTATKKVTGVKMGVTSIMGRFDEGRQDTLEISVIDAANLLTIEANKPKIEIGDSTEIIALYNSTIIKDYTTLQFISHDETIAKVSANGIVTALKSGTVVITVSDTNGNTASVVISVVDNTSSLVQHIFSQSKLQLAMRQLALLPLLPYSVKDSIIIQSLNEELVSCYNDTTVFTFAQGTTILLAKKNGVTIDSLLVTVVGYYISDTIKVAVGDSVSIPLYSGLLDSSSIIKTINYYYSRSTIFGLLEGETMISVGAPGSPALLVRVIVTPSTIKITEVKVLNNGYSVELKFNKPIELYDGIEKDFSVMLANNESLKAGGEFTVTRVMVKANDPYTLVLIFDSPVPSSNIAISYKNATTFDTSLTGTTSLSESTIAVYPVPAINTITFEAAGLSSIGISTLDGKVLSKTNVSDSTANISVSELPAGLYVATITTNNGTVTKLIEKK